MSHAARNALDSFILHVQDIEGRIRKAEYFYHIIIEYERLVYENANSLDSIRRKKSCLATKKNMKITMN